ncbi:MAG TPA: phosphomannose isomerase type II C-terminal cupin domain [Acidobacteriota bacterium]|nr:cupin domain-containing protein [Acidobacteriota bacterium]HQG90189.1 phosphomannose isomerase type II C-terminal cupin domain [Acidobacteriota bacterium]HQK87244.1 phosphomannose isomerase type II C-terminal cupin domain [Acidobacteriota bacterium]
MTRGGLNEDVRPWGRFIVLDEGPGFKVKRIEVAAGKRLSLQSHRHRREQWTVVQGEAVVSLDGVDHRLVPGGSIGIPRQARHRVASAGPEPLVFIEVQTGDYLGEDDITRHEDDFNRT